MGGDEEDGDGGEDGGGEKDTAPLTRTSETEFFVWFDDVFGTGEHGEDIRYW